MVGEIATKEGELHINSTEIARLEHELQLREIRAPVTGTLIQAHLLERGQHVAQGEEFGTLSGAGIIRAVAHYAPTVALGRIEPGQNATLRFDGVSTGVS